MSKVINKIKKSNWEIKSDLIPKSIDGILDILLANRGLKTKKEKDEFFFPIHPDKISLEELGINKLEVKKAIEKIKESKDGRVMVYGDYDADGICATAVLWEALYSLGYNSLPYIPERLGEGYGLNGESIKKLKNDNPDLRLIISVDNGIVAHDAVLQALKLGVDVVITDHHEKGEKYPNASAIVHTEKICGAAISWILSREIKKDAGVKKDADEGLDLVGMATIADQVPLIGPNRSFAKYGIEALKSTKRKGINKIVENTSLVKEDINSYSIGYVIAPRINASGRLEHAIDSLRLLCTKNSSKADELASYLEKINSRRQDIVDKAVSLVLKKDYEKEKIIIVKGDFNEGIIGLIASKLTEAFYKPSIVFTKNKNLLKASARSVSGIDIIREIRKQDKLLVSGGGHSMAAGFSIKTTDFSKFKAGIVTNINKLLKEKIPEKKLAIDLSLNFENITWDLARKLKTFEPWGISNTVPVFATKGITVKELRLIGKKKDHLKMIVGNGNSFFQSIAFGLGHISENIKEGDKLDIAYSIEENVWNNTRKIQLKIKDIKLLPSRQPNR